MKINQTTFGNLFFGSERFDMLYRTLYVKLGATPGINPDDKLLAEAEVLERRLIVMAWSFRNAFFACSTPDGLDEWEDHNGRLVNRYYFERLNGLRTDIVKFIHKSRQRPAYRGHILRLSILADLLFERIPGHYEDLLVRIP